MQQSYMGSVKNWNPDKGWGFIECAATAQIYGTDVFLLRSQLPGGQQVHKGDRCYFQISSGAGKAPEATNVHIISNLTQMAGVDSSHVGTVKSWNPEKGWGHIECAATEAIYGKDIFLLRSALGGGSANVSKGQQVRFGVVMGQKGPEATNLKMLTASAPQAPNGPWAWNDVIDRITHVPGQQMPVAMSEKGKSKVFFGWIKKYESAKGWGHIDCDQTRQVYGKDMFFMRSSLGDQVANVGNTVSFTVQQGAKGVQAESLTVYAPGTFQTASEPGVTFHGSIKSWNAEKGWGHLECAEAREIFHKDMFLHKKQLGEHVPQVGEKYQFNVNLNENGQPEAVSVLHVTNFGKGAVRASPY
eukprot:TRINITY_DN1628_c0_g1_i1.p1 TRINITY_DN1628_c0_g1~~TRINITY_DN1628_c0_g1_i1.p1  ORF type:complete len:411 (+),score=70.19 TRINITY_DN1628_c0_g1_i1:161-1234(+)